MRRRGYLGLAWSSLVLALLACNAPALRATPGVAPTLHEAPTFTPSPESLPAESGTAAPTRLPVTQPALPTGALIDFESWGTWRRGDQPNGTFEQSGEHVYGGQYSGRLQYDFVTAGNDFVVFLHTVAIPGTPDRMSAWVYGDGSGHFLNAWVRDSEGEVWQATFGRVDHTAWKQMSAEIRTGQDWPWGHISGPDNGAVDYPLEFYALVLDDGEDSYAGSGILFVDEITVP